MDTTIIGKRLAHLRKEHNMTQKELAEALHVTDKAISKWENGGSLPELTTLINIAKMFSLTLEELLSNEDTTSLKGETIELTKKEKIAISFVQLLQNKLLVILYVMVSTTSLLLSYACHKADSYLDLIHIGLYASILLFIITQIIFGYWWYKKTNHNDITYIVEGQTLQYQNITYNLFDVTQIYTYKEYALLYIDSSLAIIKYDDLPILMEEKCISKINAISYHILLIISSIILSISTLLETAYLLLLSYFNFEFIYSSWHIGLWILIVLSLVNIIVILLNKWHNIYLISFLSVITLTAIVSIYFIRMDNQYTVYYESSPDSSNHLVMKKNTKTESIVYYHDTFMLFAKPTKEIYNQPVKDIMTDWVEDDICVITFVRRKSQDVFVATYGNRNEGYSYDNVITSLHGKWKSPYEHVDDYEFQYSPSLTTPISVKSKDGTKLFTTNQIRQFGTTAIVLYEDNNPLYVISLNKDFVVDNNDSSNNGGTISLTPLGTKKKETIILENIFVTEELDMTDVTKTEDERETENLLLLMDSIIAEDPDLVHYTPTYESIAIHNTSGDMFDIVRQGVENLDKAMYNGAFSKIDTQISEISIHAGTIKDFYVEVKSISTYYDSDNNPVVDDEYSFYYRIKQSNQSYLIYKIKHGIIGDLHIKPVDPVSSKLTKEDPAYFYSIP